MSTAPTDPADPILRLREVHVARAGGWSVQLPELDLSAGRTAALVGPSGCGKTTLLLGWTGLLPDLQVRGQRQFLGADWPAAATAAHRAVLAGPVTVLLQDAKAALDPLQRIGVQIATVVGADARATREALVSLGLTDPDRILRAFPHQLSGGQAQKVLLAIAWLRGPQLLVADEPTANLDGASVDGFVDGLQALRERYRLGVLLSTHDLELVRAVGAEVYDYQDGAFRRAGAGVVDWPAVPREPVGAVVLQAIGIQQAFGAVTVLRDVSLEVRRGEIVAIVGPSGCGKSTLARILTGHLAPARGQVVGSARQLLFQDAFASLTPHRTIGSLLDETRSRAFDAAAEAAALGLPADRLDRLPAELSGGERRRAALLRALSVEPPVLVLDEPTASLDHPSALSVMEMIVAVQRRRRLACVLITHDAAMARAYAHRVLELHDGSLA